MNRTRTLLQTLLTFIAVVQVLVAGAQTRYWVAAEGRWNDARNWSEVAHGAGGAGVPRATDDVVIAPEGNCLITLDEAAQCHSLTVDGSRAAVRFAGPAAASLEIAGAWSSKGDVQWQGAWPIRLSVRRNGVELDLRGTPVRGDVVLDGTGSWSVVSDLRVGGDLRIKQGTLIANASRISASRIRTEAPGRGRVIAGRSVWAMDEAPDPELLRQLSQPTTVVIVAGRSQAVPVASRDGVDDRDINVCGTDPGQTPFTVNAQVVTNYNGYGVRCRGECNATVTVTASGGSGNFTYTWLNGGPPTATWTAACGGPQLVVVTDVTQGISCPVQVNVSEPAPIGVIFFGQGTPPSCSDVCNGTRTALAVGGVTPATYNWNNGAGSSSSFSQLCAGSNTLVITDANTCTFDTTFIFNVLPISPNLTFSNANCFGECDGSATVAPAGGTGGFQVTWTPPPPVQGALTVNDLCAGNHSVRVADANGCDTTVAFVITEPPPFTITTQSTAASCSGQCDATATVNASGSAGPYSFSWTPEPGAGQGTSNASGLCAGTYTVLVTDVPSGCDTLVTINISAPPPFTVLSTVSDATCANTCDGNIALLVTGGTPGYTYLWTPTPATGQGTPNVSGLCPGTYTLALTDIAGCDTSLTFVVNAPPPLLVSATATDASCAGVCDGEVILVVSGGTPGYTFAWSPAPPVGQGTAAVSGLCAGVHTVSVADANGCDTTLSITINEPLPLSVTQSQTDVSCGNACDGTASVVVAGGTPDYTFLWTPAPATGQGTASATGICAGPVSLLITDANGCTLTVPFTIDPAVPIQLSLQLTPASCPTDCDGTAGVIVSGGLAPYGYVWDPAPGAGQGNPTATGLCPQTYSLTVSDAVGCDTTISFTITAPPPIVPNATATNVTCAGGCNGTILLVPSGGVGAYTYNWIPVPPIGQGTANVAGLCAGDWSVTIGAGACDTTITITITEPPPMTVDLSTTDVSCPGECDGTTTAVAAGGTPPFSYIWSPNPPNGQGTPTASELCPGNYTLTVADAAGCDTTLAFVILAPTAITPALTTTPETCAGPCTGTATVAPTGGTGTILVNWQPAPGGGQGTTTATGLCVGINYTVTLSDANGCDTTLAFTILPSAVIVPNISSTPVTCNGLCDGTATVGPTGGTAPYTYLWSPAPPVGQATPTVSGLCAGTWQVTITDVTGCTIVAEVLITEPPPILANSTQTDVTCAGGCNGTISLAPSGGVGAYTFNWVPTPPIGQGTANVAGLCAGDWSVTIGAGACDTTITITITEPPPMTVDLSTTDVSCPGECDGTTTAVAAGGTPPFSYTWSPNPPNGQGTPTASELCPGNYTLTVADAAGCDTTLAFVILEPTAITPALTTTPETCAGPCTGTATVAPTGGTGTILVNWQPAPGGGQGTTTATGLCAGTNYTVTLSDANGCDTTLAFTILPSAVIIPNISSTPVTCNGLCDGTATVGPTGGTAPYTFTWSPPPPVGQGTPSVSGLCAGTWQVTITDLAGCTIVAEVLITAPPPILANGMVTDPLCAGICDGTIVLNTVGGLPPYTYAWSPAPPTGQGTNTIGGLCAGTWNVSITDASGCSRDASFTTTEPAAITLDLASTPSQCQVCIGTATAVFGGGTGLLSVEWTNALGVVIGTTDSLTDLCAGIYTATIRDENGCTIQRSIPVTDSDGEDLTTTDGTTSCPNTCDGEVTVTFNCSDLACTIAWSDAQGNDLGISSNTVTGLCPGDYLVTVTNASGCISIDTATVTAPTVVTLNISSTPVSCTAACDGTATVGVADGTPPYTFTWDPAPPVGQGTPSVAQLCAGVYTITVGDGGGCETEAQVLITEPPPLTLFSSIVIDASCTGTCDGNITLLVAGGTGSYSFLWSPAPMTGQGASAAFGYCAGNVSVTITDAAGCSIQRTFTIEEPQPLQVTTSTTPSTCPNCDGTATATVIGGNAPYTFSWVLGGAEVSTDPSPTGLCGGVCSLTVRDQYGCMTQAVVQVSDSNAEVLQPINGNKLCANVCDAVVGVNFTCSAPPCTIQWTDADGNVLAQDVTELTGLCAGVYTVQVTNGNGCVSLADAVVSPSSLIIPNISSTPTSCAGACDATATAGPFGGVAPYTFNWSPEPGGGQGTPQATGLCAGVYDLLIQDASGCDTTVQVLILEPPALVQQAVVTPATCAGQCDGSIVVTSSGGTGGHAFSWDPMPPNGQGSNGAFGLCAGDWTLTVTDANGCTSVVTYTILEPPPLVLVGGSIPSECGVCNGTAHVAANGGTAPYTYLWSLNGSIYGTLDSLTAVCAGLYDVLVTDQVGCTATALVPVQDLNGEVLNTLGDTTSCPGVCDGTAEVLFTCGEPTCTVAWFDATGTDLGLSSTQINGLCAGDYIVTVTNGLGCLSIDTASVGEPDPIIPNLSTTPVVCFGECNGTATVGPTGGVAPYTYLWDPEPANGQGNPVAEGLCVGTTQVTITDAAGCSVVLPVLILGPAELTADAQVSPISCNGVCDGTVSITPQGGVAPYTFNWTPEPPTGQGTNNITGLCAGVWTCVLTDENGCDTTLTFTIVEPPLLEAQITATHNLCNADCDGTATLVISGGVAPYSIVWSDASGTVFATDTIDVSQLCAGDFSVRITDVNGCTLEIPFTITEGTPIEANLVFTGETCAGPCDGTAAVSPSGGTGSYTYLWTPEPGVGQGTDQVSGLCAGNWSVLITDALGCDTTWAFTLLPYTPIVDNAIISDVQCNGACDGTVETAATGGIGTLTYDWQPVPPNGQGTASATDLCPGAYTLVIADAAGCDSTFSYTITEPPALQFSLDALTDASCADAADGSIATTAFGGVPPYAFAWTGPGGFSATSEDITGLTPGDHHLLLTDANNCTIDTTITVGALTTIIADAGVDQQVCSGTSTSLDGSGSTGVVTWSWRDANGAEIGNGPVLVLPPLPPGDHVYTLVVSDGPCSATDQIIVSSLALPIADAGVDHVIFLSETATLGGAPTGPPGSTFVWQPDSLLNDEAVAAPVASPSVTTWFTLTVTAPNGCVDTDSVLVTVVPTIVIPNGITPNGDGRNDDWQIDFIELFPDCEVEVYNRWGELLFQSVGYRQRWDGRYKDGFVPVGTYYYVIELNDERFPEPYTGPLTVIR